MDINAFEKKIFFLFPPMGILDDVLQAVMENEYEAYTVNDPDICIELLKKYPDSILFVNIDSRFQAQGWQTWIHKLMMAPETSSVSVGVFSSRRDDDLKEKYIMDIGIQCGFIYMRTGFSALLNTVLTVLSVVEARGRRKYIRVSCADNPNCKLNIRSGRDKIITGKLYDISVVGFSCSFDIQMYWEKNELLTDVQIMLGGVLMITDVICFAQRGEGSQTLYVMLFSHKENSSCIPKIRAFLYKTLQVRMNKVVTEIMQAKRKHQHDAPANEEQELPPPQEEEIEELEEFSETFDLKDYGDLKPIDIE